MAAKTWEDDFRYSAIQASIHRIRESGAKDPLDYEGSFCVPVAQKPAVGWTPGKISLVLLVLGFACLASGAGLATLAERMDGPQSAAVLAIGVCLSLSGFAMFFVPSKFDKQIIRFLVGDRASHLFERAGAGEELLSSELSRADNKITVSVDGDDHVLILVDKTRRELLLEGTGARYRIRAEDVSYLAPFQFMNYVGAEIRCRVDDEVELHVAIARVSILVELTRQLPFLFFLRKRARNRVLQACRDAMPETLVHPAKN